nr:hypothetical protein [Smithellaceae bacterium]
KNALKKLNRQALHSAKLSFLHPQTGQRLIFFADMPSDMAELCRALRMFSGIKEEQVAKSWKDAWKK